MKKSLYRSLAKSTIKRHKNLYLPFIINGIFLLIITCICNTIGSERVLKRQFIVNISWLAFLIMLIFSAIIILSTYNFIQKRKYEENGLYMVLGMERKHIVMIMFWEIFYLALIVIVFGCLLGFILYKLSLGLYLNMVNLDTNIFKEGIFQNPFPTFMAGIAFLLIYLILFIVNVNKMRKFSAVDLMRESKAGDKNTKFKSIVAILGLLSLAGGYYISITTKNPMKAITNLFIAVVLVIIGTYLAFSVIIALILNLLKKNKNFYYKKENFAAISGLMFRVKNSSRSLAGITILSTSLMVILTSGLSLYLGTNDKINNLAPSDYVINHEFDEKKDKMELDRLVGEYLKENKLKASSDNYIAYATLAYKDVGTLRAFPKDMAMNDFDSFDKFANVNIILTKNHDNLFKDFSLIEVNKEGKENLKIANFDRKIKVKKYKDIDFKFSRSPDIVDTIYYLTNDKDQFYRLKDLFNSKNETIFHNYGEILMVNKEDNSKKWDTFDVDINNYLSNKGINYYGIISRDEQIAREIQVNSSIFFIGILLGIAFLVSTALFIYYKQLSEGFDDVERFRIMRQVGMTDNEAKSTISKQIGVVVILPIIFTIMHTCFAIPILNQFLKAVGLANLKIMLISMGLSAIFFVIFYAITFLMTEKVYMNLILEKNNKY